VTDQDRWAKLLDTATGGQLSEPELGQAIAALKDPSFAGDRYTLIYIIGRALATSQEELVAIYLNCPEDPMLARIALQTLCSFWGKTPRYLAYVRRFMCGVDWDTEDDVRQIAISIAGEYVRKTWDDGLFQELLDIATNEDSFPWIRQFAIQALARTMGDEWPDIPRVSMQNDPNDEWHRETLERAFQRFVDMK
jgi:hypothetical protein